MRLFTTNRCPPTVALCAAFTMACGGPMPDEAEDVSELRRRGSYPTPRVDHSGPIDPPPANLRVAQNGHSMVSLAFQCGRFANRHELRAKQGNGRWRVVRRSLRCSSTSRRPQYAYQRVLPETRYCFRVKAINSTDTAQSNHVCFTSLADRTTPTPPTIRIGERNYSKVTVHWTDNSTNETTFRVYRKSGSQRWRARRIVTRHVPAHRGTGQEFTWVDRSVQANVVYEYKVRAVTRHAHADSPVRTGWAVPSGGYPGGGVSTSCPYPPAEQWRCRD